MALLHETQKASMLWPGCKKNGVTLSQLFGWDGLSFFV
jgi:hypothetical protein